MSTWVRVFGRSEAGPDLDRLCRVLQARVPGLAITSQDGTRGWEHLELRGSSESLTIERFWRDEEGIRGELQAWAAWLETVPANPHAERLMAHFIQTQQVFTMQCDTGTEFAAMVGGVLAAEVEGVWQMDGKGVFDAGGELLVAADD